MKLVLLIWCNIKVYDIDIDMDKYKYVYSLYLLNPFILNLTYNFNSRKTHFM